MKILFAASECAPIAKVGGLADVVGSLPRVLKNLGLDVKIVIPKYEMAREEEWNLKMVACFDLAEEKIFIWQGFLPKSDVLIYLLENKKYLSQGEIYSSSADFKGFERFLFFSKAVLEFFKKIGWSPDILHCHDWETAIIPSLIKIGKLKTKTMLTIHNLSHQGNWNSKDIFDFLKLKGDEVKSFKMRDKNNNFNILQQGIVNVNLLTTVSPTYNKEILTKKYGERLEKDLRKNKNKLFGILNGIDTEIFNPETDKNLKANYSLKNIDKKIENKIDLQEISNFEKDPKIPLFGFIGRLTSQKGINLIIETLPQLLKSGYQFVVLGVGSSNYEQKLLELSQKYPQNVSVNIKFDPVLTQKIYAGCDIILIPSLFEPCGLIQMFGQRYGTIPVARRTGGLVDTIEDGKTGFLFKKYDSKSFLKAIKKCLKTFKTKRVWQKMIKRAMKKDFSWEKSAKEYLKLYQRLLK